MRVHAAFLISLSVGLGCSRGFSPIQPAEKVTNADGTPCTSADGCSSGICADGVCCETTCGSDEVGNAPRAAGTCQPRPPGDACTRAEQCPNGWCFDGVCCSTDCSGACQSCNAQGSCQLAADDTDPRGDCPGVCNACFGGSCGPAIPGTNPRSTCGPDLVCGLDQQCHLNSGEPCAADSECGTGRCVVGKCMNVQVEPLTVGLDPLATKRAVLGVASNTLGDVAVVIRDARQNSVGTYLADTVRVLFRSGGGPWAAVDVYNDLNNQSFENPDYPFALPVFLGRRLFVVSHRPVPERGTGDCMSAPDACGLVAVPVGPTGTLGTPTAIDLNAYGLDALNGYATPEGALVVDYADARGLHHATRDAAGVHAWGQIDLDTPGGYSLGTLSAVRLHDVPMLAYDGNDAVHVISLDGGPVTALGTADGYPCPGVYPAVYGARGAVADGPILFTLDCLDVSYAVSLDPANGDPHATVVSMHDTTVPMGELYGIGVMAAGPEPRVAYARTDPALTNTEILALASANGDAVTSLYELGQQETSISSLDLAVSGETLSIAIGTEPTADNTSPAQSFLVTVGP